MSVDVSPVSYSDSDSDSNSDIRYLSYIASLPIIIIFVYIVVLRHTFI